jgi:dipeptidase E
MITLWKKLGIDKLLKKAVDNGAVLSGLSAGSICWFKYGISDSARFDKDDNKTNEAGLIRVDGLDFINALHCPHYDVEKDRKESLKTMMKEQSVVGIAIDNCCALELVNDTYRIISSKDDANAYVVYWKGDDYIERLIPKNKEFKSAKEVLYLI